MEVAVVCPTGDFQSGCAIFEKIACLHYGHPLPQSETLGDGQNTDSQSMDSPNGLPLKWTTPKNNILNEYHIKL